MDDDDIDDRDRSARYRRPLTQTDAEDIVNAASEVARRRSAPSSAEQVRRMELFDAEIFGVDGRGGRFAAMEALVRTTVIRVDALDTFKVRVLAFASMGAILGGIVVAVVERFLK